MLINKTLIAGSVLCAATLITAGCSSSTSGSGDSTQASSSGPSVGSHADYGTTGASSSQAPTTQAADGKVPDGASATQIAAQLGCTKPFSTNPSKIGGVTPTAIEGCTYMSQPVQIETWASSSDQKKYLAFFDTALKKVHKKYVSGVGANDWDISVTTHSDPTAAEVTQATQICKAAVDKLGGTVVSLG